MSGRDKWIRIAVSSFSARAGVKDGILCGRGPD
jgi:hypothetical protein